MQHARQKPPRAWAAEISAAWLAGQPTAPVIDSVPPEFRDQAARLARSYCARVLSVIKEPPPDTSSRVIRRLLADAEIYLASRSKK